MIPLRLEVNEQASLRAQEVSDPVKDEIEERHNLLLNQVRSLYVQKQRELEEYINRRADEYEAAKNREQEESKHASAGSVPRVKSIVKRSPSTSEKRVSFSSSPPQVELFKKDSFEEDDYEHDERRPPVVEANGEAVKFRTRRSQPLYHFPQSRSDKSNEAISESPAELSELSESQVADAWAKNTDRMTGESNGEFQRELVNDLSKERREHKQSSPERQEHKQPSPEHQGKRQQEHRQQEHRQPSPERHNQSDPPKDSFRAGDLSPGEELFQFEENIEPAAFDEAADLHAEEHHAPFNDAILSPAENLSPVEERPEPVYEDPLPEQMLVGSAPISIASRPKFEADGGRAARGEADRRQQEKEDMDLEIQMSPSDVTSQTDPSRMSFRQRMEWENMTSRSQR